MNNLILITPTKEYEAQVMEFREEMLKNGGGFYGCSGVQREIQGTGKPPQAKSS